MILSGKTNETPYNLSISYDNTLLHSNSRKDYESRKVNLNELLDELNVM